MLPTVESPGQRPLKAASMLEPPPPAYRDGDDILMLLLRTPADPFKNSMSARGYIEMKLRNPPLPEPEDETGYVRISKSVAAEIAEILKYERELMPPLLPSDTAVLATIEEILAAWDD
jgi:hypothetical protein